MISAAASTAEGLGGCIEETDAICIEWRKDDQPIRSHGCSAKFLVDGDLVRDARKLEGLGGRIEETDAINTIWSQGDQSVRGQNCPTKLCRDAIPSAMLNSSSADEVVAWSICVASERRQANL